MAVDFEHPSFQLLIEVSKNLCKRWNLNELKVHVTTVIICRAAQLVCAIVVFNNSYPSTSRLDRFISAKQSE